MNKRAVNKESFQIYPIGYVRRSGDDIRLEILEPFQPALKNLDLFSHVIVLWWVDGHDNDESRSVMQTEPPYAQETVMGVFATRAEYRPNPIAVTTCEILEVNQERGIVRVTNMDAYDGTPIVDLKAYFPVCDRVRDVQVPKWLVYWPEWWMPEEEPPDWLMDEED